MKDFISKLVKIDFKTIVLVVLLAVILFQQCNKNSKPDSTKPATVKIDGKKYDVIKNTIDTQYLPSDPQIVLKKGKDIFHDTTIYVPIPFDRPIDTMSILKDFFAKNIYKDTLKLNDSMGFVSINDTISQNKIISRKWTAILNQKTIKETVYLREQPKTQLYFGLNASFNKTDVFSTLGTGVIMKTKTDNLYQLGIGVGNNKSGQLTPYIGGGMYWKIKIKK